MIHSNQKVGAQRQAGGASLGYHGGGMVVVAEGMENMTNICEILLSNKPDPKTLAKSLNSDVMQYLFCKALLLRNTVQSQETQGVGE